MKPNIIADKSKAFALKTIQLHNYLVNEKKEYVMSRQILKSGTSIGANIRESKNAQSLLDFINKLSIALKEADETAYWLELLTESKTIEQNISSSLFSELNEIISLLTSIIKTTKNNINKKN